MTIKMRLDTEGLRALIASNPLLEVEIGREVLNNIKADVITRGVETQVMNCLRGMVTQSGGWNPTYTAKSPELIKAVAAAAAVAVEEAVASKLQDVISTRVTTALQYERELFSREMKTLLKELVTPEMAREIMREKILQ